MARFLCFGVRRTLPLVTTTTTICMNDRSNAGRCEGWPASSFLLEETARKLVDRSLCAFIGLALNACLSATTHGSSLQLRCRLRAQNQILHPDEPSRGASSSRAARHHFSCWGRHLLKSTQTALERPAEAPEWHARFAERRRRERAGEAHRQGPGIDGRVIRRR